MSLWKWTTFNRKWIIWTWRQWKYSPQEPGPSQIGLGDKRQIPYNLKKVGEKTCKKKTSAVDTNYLVRFDVKIPERNRRLSDLHRELVNTFDDILSRASQGLDPSSDLGLVIIHHDGWTNPVYVPHRPLKDLTGKGVMEHLQNVLTSH